MRPTFSIEVEDLMGIFDKKKKLLDEQPGPQPLAPPEVEAELDKRFGKGPTAAEKFMEQLKAVGINPPPVEAPAKKGPGRPRKTAPVPGEIVADPPKSQPTSETPALVPQRFEYTLILDAYFERA